MKPLQIWASPEPTVARVDATSTRDQLRETGHYDRPSDMALLASLGVQAARYPVLWEHAAADGLARLDLTWARERLAQLADAGIEPIVTLLHHGSGPRYTELLDDTFAERFADYAGAVARAFPWVRRWTPINEPLTTARFATMYGLWYPNLRDDHPAFARAIVNEALAIVLAMERIRAVVPAAQLVLTEDLQRFEALDAQAHDYVAFKRERSFLSAELVMGRIVPGHVMWSYLVEVCGLPAARLEELAARAIGIDLMGFNYYPHSERLIFSHGEGELGNVPRVYAVEEPISPRPMLRAAHARLGVPLAISEVHVRGSERERTRWLLARHADALALRAEGVPLEAVGAWAAFGMIDWHVLLRSHAGAIEDGIFTFGGPGGVPRPTLVAEAVRVLARGGTPENVPEPGWWEKQARRLTLEQLISLQQKGRPDGDHLVASESALA